MKKNTIIILVAFVVVGGVLWFSRISPLRSPAPAALDNVVESGSVKQGPAEGSSGSSEFLKLGPNALYVPTQRPGNKIITNLISIDSPGYVAIHESVDGKLGAIIGVSELLGRGVHKDVTAVLSREVLDGEELIAVLYHEKSGAGFNSGDDAPVRDADENIMYMNFTVGSDAPDPSNAEMI